MEFVDRWLHGNSWRNAVVQFVLFAALFSIYDLTVLWRTREAPEGASLINYVVRDDRTDESAMYMSVVRELTDGHFSSTDPYLKEHRNVPDVRPHIPAWIGYVCCGLGGGTNGGILLLHTVPPAITAVLMVRVFAALVGPIWAFSLSLASVAGICYSMNYYARLLRLVDLIGQEPYNPERHLMQYYEYHFEFTRFFSPGITLGFFLAGLLAAAVDPDFLKRRTAWLVGAAIGLQFDVYPHGAIVLATIAAVLLGIGAFRRAAADRSWRPALLWALVQGGTITLAATIAGAPWIARWLEFRHVRQHHDIVQRVGFWDDRTNVTRIPVLAWLAIAMLIRRAANRSQGLPVGQMLAKPEDRMWSATMFAAVTLAWIPGILASYGKFPQPWLINIRCLCYLAPMLVAYPLREWMRGAHPAWLSTPRVRFGMTVVVVGYAALLVNGEVTAGRRNSGNYAITPEMAKFRNAVLAETPSEAIVLTDDLKLTSYLVCEMDRYSYIGYGATSNASTDEMLERLMIPSLLAGRNFDEFIGGDYYNSRGLPWGPWGCHWALHHGGDANPKTIEFLRGMYDGLARMAPEDLLHRYKVDYVYSTTGKIAQQYAAYCRPTGDAHLSALPAEPQVARR